VAARVIAQMGDQAPIAEMIDALRTKQLTPRQRYAVLRALKPLADRVPAQPLITLFAQVEDGSQRAILDILGARSPRELVRQAADSSSSWVRKKALELMGDQAPFLAILPFVEDPHYENRDPDSPLLRLLGAVAEPADESGDLARRQFGQLQALGEVAADVLLDLPSVFVAGALAEATPTAPLVALDPLTRVLVQRDARALLELAAGDVGLTRLLGAASLIERAAALPPLDAVDSVAKHVPRPALVDARRLGLDELRSHQSHSPVGHAPGRVHVAGR